jgi:CDP-6-deoxy-D-xylo-4-hexulose-3-dehydrase
MSAEQLRKQILDLVERYAHERGSAAAFRAGVTAIPAAGKVLGAGELCHMVDAVLDGWLTTGRFNAAFEQRLGQFLNVEHVLTTNSGSSANLLAFSALTSPSLGERAIKPGDEVITVAAGFPTTINPILQNGCVPVFVDVTLPTYNIDVDQIESAISSRTRAIMLAHTLGNPFNLDAVCRFARKHGLWLIEDCCDALGASYAGRSVGTFGDIGTLSFYPAHHITMGEGGAVFTRNPNSGKSSNRFVTGAATAGAQPATTTPAASASPSSTATCRSATTTNTATPSSATTSRSPTYRPRVDWRRSIVCRTSSPPDKGTTTS